MNWLVELFSYKIDWFSQVQIFLIITFGSVKLLF